MSGTPGNASIWADADIYVSTDLAVALPASAAAAMPVGWGSPVGLLEGADGIVTTRSVDGEVKFAWGSKPVRKTRKNYLETVKFTVLEDNDKTRSLIFPGSSAGEIVVPVVVPVMLALEVRDGTKVRRRITKGYAEIDVDGDMSENEDDLTKVSLVATIFPDSDNKLWLEQKTPTLVSIALSPLTLGLTTGQIKAVVATGTYDDASTQVLTDVATWSSSNAAKATVRYGDVTFVAAGSTNVSCSYQGITSTAPCVVTCS